MRKGKKIAAAVCSLAMCAALVGTSAPAIPVSAEQILQSTGDVKPVDGTVTLDVKIDQNSGVTLLCVWVEYDTDNLTYVDTAPDANAFKATGTNPATLFYKNVAKDGKVALMWLNGYEDFTTTGSVAKLTFNVKGTAKEKYNFKVYTEKYSTYDVALMEKTVKVDFTKDSKTGDLNGDNSVDISDVLATIDFMMSGTYNASADLVPDGKIDISDVLRAIDIMMGVV